MGICEHFSSCEEVYELLCAMVSLYKQEQV